MASKYDIPLSAFEKSIQLTLSLWHDPARLGAESPLASSYFLADELPLLPGANPAAARGEALRRLILKAAATLWDAPLPSNRQELLAAIRNVRQQSPDSPRYAWLILELRAFQQFIKPKRVSDIWEDPDLFPGSKAEHYRDFHRALQQLSTALLHHFLPKPRSEHPLPSPIWIGEQAEIQKTLDLLMAGGLSGGLSAGEIVKKSVMISGSSGMGKTALATRIVAAMAPTPTFWFTFRPTLNDRLESLLFSLAQFFYQQGASQLWRFLLAEGGVIKEPQVAMLLVQEDLSQLRTRSPLLCFDELDSLYQAQNDELSTTHVQIIRFLEQLRGQVSLLLIGQRARFEADLQIVVRGLQPYQIVQLWQQVGLPLTAEQANELQVYSGGNPRLLLLCLNIYREQTSQDLSFNELLATLPAAAGFQPLFQRIWDYATAAERALLMRLSVFRGFAPDHLWDATLLQSLSERHLIERNALGGVAIAHTFAEIIYAQLSAEARLRFHQQAAEPYLNFAEYTEAAWHCWKAEQPNLAIQLWYPNRHNEILRGHAAQALTLFDSISHERVGKQEAQSLVLLRAELHEKCGQPAKALADLSSVDWEKTSELSVRASRLRGNFEDALGYSEAALQSYEQGSQSALNLLSELSRFHYQRSLVHFYQRSIPQARRQARLVECQLHNLFGLIEEEEGRYHDALLSYQKALTLAQSVEDLPSLALTQRNLAGLLGGRMNRPQEGVQYTHSAIATYEQMGDRINAARARTDLLYIYVQSREFQAVTQIGPEVYHYHQALQDRYNSAVDAHNLAEAWFELGDLDRSERYAQESLAFNEKAAIPYALYDLGRIRSRQQAWHEAEGHFQSAIRQAQQNEDVYFLPYCWRELGKHYIATQQFAEAGQALHEARQLFQHLEMKNEVDDVMRLLDVV